MATAKDPSFDIQAAHKYFAAHCFNSAWDLIEKKDRTSEDDRLMVALNQASIFHWLQRPDCSTSDFPSASGKRRGFNRCWAMQLKLVNMGKSACRTAANWRRSILATRMKLSLARQS